MSITLSEDNGQSRYSHLERGRSELQFPIAVQIAKVIGCQPQDLFVEGARDSDKSNTSSATPLSNKVDTAYQVLAELIKQGGSEEDKKNFADHIMCFVEDFTKTYGRSPEKDAVLAEIMREKNKNSKNES